MKKITKNMLKYADNSNMFTSDIVSDVNHGKFESFTFSPHSVLNDSEYINALKGVIYSIVKTSECEIASIAINNIASIFETCPQYAERYMRGTKGIVIQNRFGLDNLIID